MNIKNLWTKVKGFVLLVVAFCLGLFLIPFFFISGLIMSPNANDYAFRISLSIDQLGNVVGGPLFNKLLIKEKYYIFGDPDDTISYVLARNKAVDNLTKLGMGLAKILDTLDPGHTDMPYQRAIVIKRHRLKK